MRGATYGGGAEATRSPSAKLNPRDSVNLTLFIWSIKSSLSRGVAPKGRSFRMDSQALDPLRLSELWSHILDQFYLVRSCSTMPWPVPISLSLFLQACDVLIVI